MASAPLPIVLLTHEFHPRRGGIATVAEEMARGAAELGHRVEVWAPGISDGAEKSWPFPVRRLAMRGTHDLGCQFRLAREMARRRHELARACVYLAEPGPMLAFMLLRAVHRTSPARLALTFHGSEILRFAGNPLVRPLARRLIRQSHRVSTLSAYTRDLLFRHFPEARERHCLTPGALRSGADLSVPARRPGNRVVILTVGRIHPRKGQLATLHALRRLPPALQAQVEYRMVGPVRDPAYERLLKAAASDAGFPVTFAGAVPDPELNRHYAEADLFALTSVPHRHSVEGFGLVYLEAAATGLPVIAHAVGGAGEAVIDGETGLLVPPDDPRALTAAFEKLILHAGLRHSLGEAGRQRVRHLSWTDSARALFGPVNQPAFA